MPSRKSGIRRGPAWQPERSSSQRTGADREPKVFSSNIFGCLFEMSLLNTRSFKWHPPRAGTTATHPDWAKRVAPGEPDGFADVRRGCGARFAGLHGVSAAPRAIFGQPVRQGSSRQGSSNGGGRAIGVEILAAQFGNLTESQAAPSGQRYQMLESCRNRPPACRRWRATRPWSQSWTLFFAFGVHRACSWLPIGPTPIVCSVHVGTGLLHTRFLRR